MNDDIAFMLRRRGIRAMKYAPRQGMMLPEGCAFASRCTSCMKLCISKRPPLTEVSEGHFSRCWLSALRKDR